MPRPEHSLPALLLALCAGLAGCSAPPSDEGGDPAPRPDAEAAQGLAIEPAVATAVSEIPLAEVPGSIMLPPEARVAVTAPFAGAAVRVFVIEGQEVARGARLALVRAAESVQVQGELSRARSAFTLAEARAARLGQLAGEGIIAAARADEAAAELEQARARLDEAQRLAALGGVGPDGTMILRAPIAGRVAHVGVETGGSVDTLAAPFVIEAPGAYQIALQLPERLAREVRPGMAIAAALNTASGADPLAVSGTILAIAPSIDPATRSIMARASIAAAPGMVAGRNVTVTILGAGSGIAVPARAVARIGEADHVFVKQGAQWEPRKVEIIARAGDKAVIGKGIKAGETVAASSVAELKAMMGQ